MLDHRRDYPVTDLLQMVRRISLSFNYDELSDDDDSVIDSKHNFIAVDARIPGTFANSLSQVQSLAMFGKHKSAPPLLFKYLRVLIFGITLPRRPILQYYLLDNITLDLTAITQLFQLRYLKIAMEYAAYNVLIQLPDKIQGLRHLETLDVANQVLSVPSDIIYLPHLSHLIVPLWMPIDGLENMKSLRTLEGFVSGW